MATNDQKRVKTALLPELMGLAMAEGDGDAERDCTLLSRLFLQGADPLFLMEVCPDQFRTLCTALALSEARGREAIERAHVEGPGCLLDGGTGLAVALHSAKNMTTAIRLECLWLVLAGMGADEGYPAGLSVRDRLQRTADAISQFARFTAGAARTRFDVMCAAQAKLASMERCEATLDPRTGIPLYTTPFGFYLGYKSGYSAVAVRAPGATHYGTLPSTTLAEQRIEVGKQITPHYGIVFDEEGV